MANTIKAEFEIEDQKFKISFKAYLHFEQKTGVPFSEIGNAFGKLSNLVALLEGASISAGQPMSEDQVIDMIDSVGLDKFYLMINEAMSDVPQLAEEAEPSVNGEKKR